MPRPTGTYSRLLLRRQRNEQAGKYGHGHGYVDHSTSNTGESYRPVQHPGYAPSRRGVRAILS